MDPYPYFDISARSARCQREPHHGVVMVTGYDEAVSVYTNTTTFSSCNAVTGPFPGFPVPLEGDDVSELIEQHRDELPFSDQITAMDPPKHKAHRGLLMRLITPKRLKRERGLHVAATPTARSTSSSRGASASSSATSPGPSPCT